MDICSIFSRTFAGDDMLIAYTVSDGTYLIFGGELKAGIDKLEIELASVITICTVCFRQ